MYTREQKIQNSLTNLSNYIEGFDVYNSLFLQKISDPTLAREKYQITVHEFRPDLMAQDFYGSAEYMGILLVQARVDLKSLRRGVVLELLPKKTIDNIISGM